MEPFAVTNHRFAAFVADTGYVSEAEREGWSFVFAGRLPDEHPPTRALASAPWWRAVPGASWSAPDGPGSAARPDHPVVHVSLADALAFCAGPVCGCRARRSGTRPRAPAWARRTRGATSGTTRAATRSAATSRTARAGTVPVDAYEPNPAGLHNVVGNVWEWTADGLQCGGSYLCHPSYCRRNQLSGRSTGDAPMGHVGFRVISAAWSNGNSATPA